MVCELAQKHGNHLAVGRKDRRIGGGEIVFDRGVQVGQAVVGHHREHVVFDVVIHVPIDETADAVHVNGTAVEPVVDYVIGEARVLQNPRHDVMPSAIKARQTDEHER